MLLIYTDIQSPRVDYIFKFIFTEILGIDYEVTNDQDTFFLANLPKINYSKSKIKEEFFIQRNDLLAEDIIEKQLIDLGDWEDLPIFFQTSSKADVPFDVFAASFFLITRYEEYLPFEGDQHGRFQSQDSVAFRNGFLHEPIVDEWAYKMKDSLKTKYPDLKFKQREFKYRSTIDIDNAYAFLYKGTVRTLGASFRSLFRFDMEDTIKRWQTLAGEKDPFDTYSYFYELHKKYNVEPTWFFLVGEYSTYDKNVDPNSENFQNLIRDIAERDFIGIHPSYESNNSFVRLKNEVKFLEGLASHKITRSRQHYLKLLFAETYRNLIDLGICEDYTMGYASDIGFRASTCTPFNFYDIHREKESCLKIFPFQVMDTTLNQYLKLTVDEALESIKLIIDRVKKVDGTFISLWHNESLSDHGYWKGWEPVYKNMLAYIYG